MVNEYLINNREKLKTDGSDSILHVQFIRQTTPYDPTAMIHRNEYFQLLKVKNNWNGYDIANAEEIINEIYDLTMDIAYLRDDLSRSLIESGLKLINKPLDSIEVIINDNVMRLFF